MPERLGGVGASVGGLPGSDLPGSDVVDVLAPRPVLESTTVHHGMIWDIVAERVDLGEAGPVRREFVSHPGAVAVLTLDDRGRVLLVQQYRHPAEHMLWELPAGLLDVAGEPPVDAARRELAEEGDLVAGTWHVLLDIFMSPGGSDEAVRIFLARDVSPVADSDRFAREHEELGMVAAWVDLDEARDAVLAGRVHSPTAVCGLMAAVMARDSGWATLRPDDAPWPEHKAYR